MSVDAGARRGQFWDSVEGRRPIPSPAAFAKSLKSPAWM
jgi:hypothetical protein